MVPTPLFSVILERMSSPRLPSTRLALANAAQVDLVARHHPDKLKDLLPTGDEARAQHVVHAERAWSERRPAQQGSPPRQEIGQHLQVVQDEPVAVVGQGRRPGKQPSGPALHHGPSADGAQAAVDLIGAGAAGLAGAQAFRSQLPRTQPSTCA